MSQTVGEQPLNFESSFARLEQILERMNSSTITLDESLKLFEEGDKLIGNCNQRLTQAERTVETLIKSRSGELALNPNQTPATAPFPSSSSNAPASEP